VQIGPEIKVASVDMHSLYGLEPRLDFELQPCYLNTVAKMAAPLSLDVELLTPTARLTDGVILDVDQKTI